jgi:DNA replication protein DnaC
MDAPVGHPNFGRLFPCECTVTRREERLVDDLWLLSNLDAMGDLNFRNFDRSVEGVQEAYDAAWEYAQSLQGWILFTGGCGVGKTHLAVAIAQMAMDRAKLSVYFSVVPDLLDQLRATFDPSNGVAYDERFNMIRNAQLLILDDLGTENTTPWAKEKLYQIINFRYNEHLPTVVTCNLDIMSIDERIRSRLADRRTTRLVQIDAGDYREPPGLSMRRLRR